MQLKRFEKYEITLSLNVLLSNVHKIIILKSGFESSSNLKYVNYNSRYSLKMHS